MKILVTGASGFLGSTLCRELDKKGAQVIGVNSKTCDLTKIDSLNQFNSEKFDQIYHLAAWTQAGDFCLYHPGEQWIINQQINTNILAWWKNHQSQAKFIGIGTSCAYDPNVELKEENYLEGKPIDSLYTYAMTKRMLYVGLKSLNKQFGLNYLYVVPSTLYGPDYHLDGRQMHFIFDLIRKILRGKYYGEEVILWGDGNQQREIIHVNDFVANLILLNERKLNDIYNIGAGDEQAIRRFAQIISRIVGFDENIIKYDTSKYTGARSKCLLIEKAKSELKDSYQIIDLETGLKSAIEWVQDNLIVKENK